MAFALPGGSLVARVGQILQRVLESKHSVVDGGDRLNDALPATPMKLARVPTAGASPLMPLAPAAPATQSSSAAASTAASALSAANANLESQLRALTRLSTGARA